MDDNGDDKRRPANTDIRGAMWWAEVLENARLADAGQVFLMDFKGGGSRLVDVELAGYAARLDLFDALSPFLPADLITREYEATTKAAVEAMRHRVAGHTEQSE